MALTVRKAGKGNALPLATIMEVAEEVAIKMAPSVKQAVSAGLNAGRGAAFQRRNNQKSRKANVGQKKQPQSSQSNPNSNMMQVGKTISLAGSDKLRMVQKDIVPVNNGVGAGVANFNIVLGTGTTLTSNNATLVNLIPRFGPMATSYRQFMINSVSFTFIPNQGYTTGGTMSMGVDPSPLASVPTGLGNVLHHSCSKMFDIKSGATIMWKPSMASKGNVPRYTVPLGSLDEDELSFGIFQMYSPNSLAANVNIGNILIAADLTFLGAT